MRQTWFFKQSVEENENYELKAVYTLCHILFSEEELIKYMAFVGMAKI